MNISPSNFLIIFSIESFLGRLVIYFLTTGKKIKVDKILKTKKRVKFFIK